MIAAIVFIDLIHSIIFTPYIFTSDHFPTAAISITLGAFEVGDTTTFIFPGRV